MRVREVRELSVDELTVKIADTRKEVVDMRFQLASRKLENPAKLRQARRLLARLLTIEAQKNSKGT
jgi:large subunit ribosomal protein L29